MLFNFNFKEISIIMFNIIVYKNLKVFLYKKLRKYMIKNLKFTFLKLFLPLDFFYKGK